MIKSSKQNFNMIDNLKKAKLLLQWFSSWERQITHCKWENL